MRATNKQVLAKCKSQNALVVIHEEALTTRSGKAETLEQQTEDRTGLSVSHRAAEMFEGSAKAGLVCKGQRSGKICAMD